MPSAIASSVYTKFAITSRFNLCDHDLTKRYFAAVVFPRYLGLTAGRIGRPIFEDHRNRLLDHK